MMSNNNLKFLVAISHFPKIGAMRFKKLINFFENPEHIWNANFSELKKSGLEEKIINEFFIARRAINPDEKWAKLDKENIKVLSFDNENYPKLLKEIYAPPFLLYYKGNVSCLNNLIIAIVGTRKITAYGKQATPLITEKLVQNNVAIASGLAVGVDALAHETAIMENGKTIGVLGSGIDAKSFYPKQNLRLVEKIIEKNGIIISEHPIGVGPLRHHFPLRNRIISGISLGTLVIEASKKSGSLITARLALEQNREVFATPGSIFSESSMGPNNLIKMGAKPITDGLDILEALDIKINYKENTKIIPETKEEKIILEFVNGEPTHIDELKRKTKLNIPVLSSALTMMEIKGKIKDLGGMNYVLGR